MLEDRKRAESDYPRRIDEAGREWLRRKPFRNAPAETARHLIDFGYVVHLLDLRPELALVELGCGPGWMMRLAARQGVKAHGVDISPEMVEIAREQAEAEGVGATFEVGDMESLDLGGRFDACLIYDALHHSPRADLVLACARRALRDGGRLLVAEPNWKHRFQGRRASEQYGVTEMGYSSRALKRMVREAGFTDVERFHNNRKRLFGNRAVDVAAHIVEPLVYRLLAPFWTQIWLRATAR